ncbi:MAG: hypothetical protein WCV63_08130 [Negativicutes bacterium]
MKKIIALIFVLLLTLILGGCGDSASVPMKLNTMIDYSAPLQNEKYANYLGRLTESRSCYIQLQRNKDEQPSMTSANMPVMDTYYLDHSQGIISNSQQPGVGPYANSVVMWSTEYGKYANINDAYYDEAKIAVKATYLDGLLRATDDLIKDNGWVDKINQYIAANPTINDTKSVFLLKLRSDVSEDIFVSYDVNDGSMDGLGDPTGYDVQLAQNYQDKINIIRKYLLKNATAIDAQGNTFYPTRIFIKDLSSVVIEFPAGLSPTNSMIIMKLSGLQHFGKQDISCVWQIQQ